MAKLKRFNGSEWVEVLDGKALSSLNTTRPTNINTIQWHEPNGYGQGGYLEYVTAVKADVTGNPTSIDGYVVNFGWDSGSWCTQLFLTNNSNNLQVWCRANTGTANEYGSWKRLAFASEVPTVYDWAKKSDLSGAINTLSSGTATPADNDYYVTQYAGGGTSVTSYHRRPHYALWNYIKGKINSATDVTAVKATTATNVTGGTINKATIDLHPESSMTLLPYITNDLAFLTMLGYSAVIRNLTTGIVISSDGGMFNCFDGSPSYFRFTVSATTDVVEIVIKHKQFNWGQQNYIGFGNSWWGAQSVKWESGYSPTGTGTAYSADSDITWTTVGSSGAVNSIYRCSGGSGYDSTAPCNYTRITLTNFRNTSPRIAQIGKIEYGSSLLQKVYVPKSGGEFYGSVTAASFVKKNGTSSQFLKADGSVDSTAYAKKSELPTVNDAKLTIQVNGTAKGTFTANASSDVAINISASDLGLSGAMKFIGSTTTGISEGSTTQSILIGTTTVTAEAGNVVLKGDKEFIWTGSKWEELGDEQSHALKSITVKGSGILSGGGSLEADREITHNQVARTNSSTMSATPGFGESFTAIGGVGSDSYGHVNAVDEKTITIPNATASQSAAGLMSASDKTKLDGIAEGANSITYSLSATDATDSDDAAITLTPSSGDAQTIKINTVYNAKSANKATHDSDGNIITSTYVKNTSDAVLSGAALRWAKDLNGTASFNGVPYLATITSNGTTDNEVYQMNLGSAELTNGVMSQTGSNDKERTFPVRHSGETNGDLGVYIPIMSASSYGLAMTGYTNSGRNIAVNASSGKLYTTLPIISNSQYGVALLSSATTQTVSPNSVSSTSGRTYAIQKNSSNQLVVNVPWTSSSSAFAATSYTKVGLNSSTATSYSKITTITTTSQAYYLSVTGYETSQNGGMAIILSTSSTAPAGSTVNSSTAAAFFEGQHGYWSYQAHAIGVMVPKGYYAHIYAYRMNTIYYHKVY